MMEAFNHFQALADATRSATIKAVRKLAFDIQASAMRNAPVDTGFLRSSIYVLAGKDTGGFRASRHRKGNQAFAPIAPPPDETIAYVVVGAKYGVYVEYGTTRHAAQPYFAPAFANAQQGSDMAMRMIEDAWRNAAR